MYRSWSIPTQYRGAGGTGTDTGAGTSGSVPVPVPVLVPVPGPGPARSRSRISGQSVVRDRQRYTHTLRSPIIINPQKSKSEGLEIRISSNIREY